MPGQPTQKGSTVFESWLCFVLKNLQHSRFFFSSREAGPLKDLKKCLLFDKINASEKCSNEEREPSREPEWHRFSLTPLLVSCMASSKLVESTKMFSLGTRVAKFV